MQASGLAGGRRASDATARHGLARVLSKRGIASRTRAAEWIRAGRVRVAGVVVLDPEFRISVDETRLTLDGEPLGAAAPIYVAVNKPRGLVTTAADERGRATVYACLEGADLPWLAPVGRLDKASEGLLLMTNDPVWAARITDPDRGPPKTYHVQVATVPDQALLARIAAGADADGEWLQASAVTLLRQGERNCWLEIVLEEGRNRQIRRLLAAFGIDVLRLVRVAIGALALGDLGKGQWRSLTPGEVRALADPARVASG